MVATAPDGVTLSFAYDFFFSSIYLIYQSSFLYFYLSSVSLRRFFLPHSCSDGQSFVFFSALFVKLIILISISAPFHFADSFYLTPVLMGNHSYFSQLYFAFAWAQIKGLSPPIIIYYLNSPNLLRHLHISYNACNACLYVYPQMLSPVMYIS